MPKIAENCRKLSNFCNGLRKHIYTRSRKLSTYSQITNMEKNRKSGLRPPAAPCAPGPTRLKPGSHRPGDHFSKKNRKKSKFSIFHKKSQNGGKPSENVPKPSESVLSCPQHPPRASHTTEPGATHGITVVGATSRSPPNTGGCFGATPGGGSVL